MYPKFQINTWSHAQILHALLHRHQQNLLQHLLLALRTLLRNKRHQPEAHTHRQVVVFEPVEDQVVDGGGGQGGEEVGFEGEEAVGLEVGIGVLEQLEEEGEDTTIVQ